MLPLLVDVHRAAVDDHRVVRLDGTRRIAALDDEPLVELVPLVAHDVVEHLAAHLRTVDDREHPHRRQKSVAFAAATSTAPVAATPASSSRPRSTCALLGAKSSRLLLNIA